MDFYWILFHIVQDHFTPFLSLHDFGTLIQCSPALLLRVYDIVCGRFSFYKWIGDRWMCPCNICDQSFRYPWCLYSVSPNTLSCIWSIRSCRPL